MKRLVFVLGFLLIVLGLSVGVTTLLAQTYPNRAIQIIIGQQGPQAILLVDLLQKS